MSSKQGKKQTRLPSPDGVRAIAIFLVILAHTNTPPLEFSAINLVPYSIYGFLGLMSVPLFIMLSGALLLAKNEGYLTFFLKRFKRVIVPWVFWSVIITTWHLFSNQAQASNLFEILKLIYKTAFSLYWFIPMLIGLYLLTPILRIYLIKARRIDLLYTLLVWIVMISILPIILGGYFLINSYVIQFLGYYLLGYIISEKTHLTGQYKKILAAFFVLLLVAPIYNIFFIPVNISAPNMLFSHISPIVVLASSLFFVFLLQIFRKIGTPLEKIIIPLGKMSFGIYLIHPLVVELFAGYFNMHDALRNNSSVILTPLFALGIFLFSYLLLYGLSRVSFLRPLIG